MKKKEKNIIVIGALNMDLVIETERLAHLGETFPGNHFYTAPGGKGGNQAVAAARSNGGNCDVHMVGCIGDDLFGSQLTDLLEKDKVNSDNIVVVPDVSSGIAIIFILPNGENHVNPVYGANEFCDQNQLNSVQKLLNNSGVLLAQQEIPIQTTFQCLKLAKKKLVTTILDPAPNRVVPDDFYYYVDVITPNETEASYLSGTEINDLNDTENAAKIIKKKGPKSVVITLGSKGAWVLSDEFEGHVPPFKVDTVASVAAGDAFNGCLSSRLSQGFGFEESVRFASAGGAICASRSGSQTAMAYLREIETIMS